ncbi:MAG: hypothetical protein COX07_07105 [Bacteroidetes bacterium CG23_combo_of_CG06-09_8_20_14_all_32_9]|nr:MAG: hypothetical protein COX07_07105 [Bacteroidetes bacterium CG23_combo_of_CG06-09_8_20_14_all_32_9]
MNNFLKQNPMKKLLFFLSIAVCTITNTRYTKLLDFAGLNNTAFAQPFRLFDKRKINLFAVL